MTPARREELLLHWSTSRLGQRRTFFQTIKRLAGFFAYADPGLDGTNARWGPMGYSVPDHEIPDASYVEKALVRPAELDRRPRARSRNRRGRLGRRRRSGRGAFGRDRSRRARGRGWPVRVGSRHAAGRAGRVHAAVPGSRHDLVGGPGRRDPVGRRGGRRHARQLDDMHRAARVGSRRLGAHSRNGWLRWRGRRCGSGASAGRAGVQPAAVDRRQRTRRSSTARPRSDWEAAATERNADGCTDCGACSFGCRRGAKKSGHRLHLALGSSTWRASSPRRASGARPLTANGRATGVRGTLQDGRQFVGEGPRGRPRRRCSANTTRADA